MTLRNGSEHRERENADARDLSELLTAWRAGKLVVRVILVVGLLVTTIAGAGAAIRGYFTFLPPHP